MNQESSLTQHLTEAQVNAAIGRSITFRVYTETKANLRRLTARYFDGATLFHGDGLWQGLVEPATVIEVIGTIADLQNIVHLAGDIGYCNAQTSVKVTFEDKCIDVPGVPIEAATTAYNVGLDLD